MHFYNSSIDYRFMHVPSTLKCQKRSTLLVAIVPSIVNNSLTRKAIRETWASRGESEAIQDWEVFVYFILSRPNEEQWKRLRNEIGQYDDLIITDLEESYDNLIYKVYAAMDFFRAWCPKVKFLLKIDDDVVISIDRMLYFLERESVMAEKSIRCKVWMKAKPKREKDSKWFVPKSVWNKQYFPNYCNGPVYLMSRNAVDAILAYTTNFTMFQIEDVYYTGIIANAAGVSRLNWSRHMLSEDKIFQKGKCKCERSIPLWFAVHSFKGPNKLKAGFNQLKYLRCLN
ncbi:hypothetical protein WR25_17097 [Diploscapter pachys]|uniref:Hexosyltransferase n=1 Tax=Diploscapter pachys TaxID=2018661 RepID=A0A2A2J9M7_9BILA|nr:hypothetical protein WR25_17097 [Diploscapter pachys]